MKELLVDHKPAPDLNLELHLTSSTSLIGIELKEIRDVPVIRQSLTTNSTVNLHSTCPGCHDLLNIVIYLHDPVSPSEPISCEAITEGNYIKHEPKIEAQELNDIDFSDPGPEDISGQDLSSIKSEHIEEVKRTAKKPVPQKNKRGVKLKRGRPRKEPKPAPADEPQVHKICNFCHAEFTCVTQYRQHVTNHDSTCTICVPPVVYGSLESLRKHVKRKHFSHHPRFAAGKDCPKCGKRYILLQIDRHVRRCQGKPVCPQCGRTAKDWPSIQAHIRTIHEGRYPFMCHTCGAQFTSKHTLEAHSLKHTRLGPFECDLCKRSFRSFYLIGNHMKKTHLQVVEQSYTCEECDKTFNNKSYFRIHKMNHLEVKPHICQTCGKGFTKRDTLRRHERIHADERKEVCTVCDKMFRDRTSLIAHLRLHTGEKPYECEICLTKFHDRGCYRGHLMKHEKELGIVLDKSIKRFRKDEVDEIAPITMKNSAD